MKRKIWLFLLISFFMIPVTSKALNLEFKKDFVISNACDNYCDSSVTLLRSLDNKGNNDGYYLLTDIGLFKYDLDFNKVYEKSMDELDSFDDYLNVTKAYSSDDANVKGKVIY